MAAKPATKPSRERRYERHASGSRRERAALSPAPVRRRAALGARTGRAELLALVLSDALARGKKRPRALLLAPTGKAAARLAEATARVKVQLDCSAAVLALIPETAQTVHRALGASRPGRPFRVDAERPL